MFFLRTIYCNELHQQLDKLIQELSGRTIILTGTHVGNFDQILLYRNVAVLVAAQHRGLSVFLWRENFLCPCSVAFGR